MSHIQKIKRNPVIIAKSQQAKALEDFHLSESLERLRNKWAQFKRQFYTSEIYREYVDTKQNINREVCRPVSSAYKNTYNELPTQTTRMKFNLLEKFTYSQRFIFLNFLALSSAVLTMRGINQSNAWRLGVKSLRNSTLTYIFGGLIIAPEIYNPLLMKWKNDAKE